MTTHAGERAPRTTHGRWPDLDTAVSDDRARVVADEVRRRPTVRIAQVSSRIPRRVRGRRRARRARGRRLGPGGREPCRLPSSEAIMASITSLRPASLDRSRARVSGLSSVAASKIRTTSNPAEYRLRSQLAAPRRRRDRVRFGEHFLGPLSGARLLEPSLADQREDLPLGAERGVHGSHGHPGLGRDGFHAGRPVSGGGEQPAGRIRDPVPCGRSLFLPVRRSGLDGRRHSGHTITVSTAVLLQSAHCTAANCRGGCR